MRRAVTRVLGAVLACALPVAVLPSSAATASEGDTGPWRDAVALRPVGGSGLEEAAVPVPAGVDRRATEPFTMVGATWTSGHPRVAVSVRRDGRWSRWLELPELAHGPRGGDVRASEVVWVGRSDAVRTRVRGPARGVRLVLIEPGRTPRDTAPRSAYADRTAPRVRDRDGVRRPPLRSRRDWGADPRWRNGRPDYNRRLKQVHVHHTATGSRYRRRDVPGLIRGMYRYHTHTLGWSDIGYNFLVDRFGRSWVGRAGGPGRRVRGAHTLGFNHSSTGIAVIGNFQRTDPGRDPIRTVARLAAWKLDREGRDARGKVWVRSHGSDRYADGERVRLPPIDGHRDTNQTACPGDRLYRRLPAIRRKADRRIARAGR